MVNFLMPITRYCYKHDSDLFYDLVLSDRLSGVVRLFLKQHARRVAVVEGRGTRLYLGVLPHVKPLALKLAPKLCRAAEVDELEVWECLDGLRSE